MNVARMIRGVAVAMHDGEVDRISIDDVDLVGDTMFVRASVRMKPLHEIVAVSFEASLPREAA